MTDAIDLDTVKLKKKAAATPQAPKITGINHVVFITSDMDKTARFYCEVLGLKIKATHGAGSKPQNQLAPTGEYSRLYFFELANGDGVAFVEFPNADVEPDSAFFHPFWPGKAPRPVKVPKKMDHVAFNVDSEADLLALQVRLRKHGVEVSDLQSLGSSPFLKSIYCYDPNGLPIEFSTWDWADPAWGARTAKEMFSDINPIAYARERPETALQAEPIKKA